MKEATLKALDKKMKWCNWETVENVPFSQGYLINEIIKEYKMPAKEVGWHFDSIGIKTKKQRMFWKDTGIGARFLGLINFDGSVEVPPFKSKKQSETFATFKELSDEIKKRDYNDILGLKCKITKEQYYEFLELLPPLRMRGGTFVLSEALSDGLYYQFSDNLMCEVIHIEDEEVQRFEMMR